MRRHGLFLGITWLLLLAFLVAGCSRGATPAPTATPQPAEKAVQATPTPQPAEKAAPTPQPKPAAKEGEKLKIAFVYVAPIGDLGWTWAHDQGRQYVEKVLGDKVETAYIESVSEGPDAERVIRDFAQKGYKLIFTTSFGYMDSTIAVAKEFPETWFVHISGYKTAPNVSTVFGRMYQARYLSGIVAGKMTKSNIIGYVAAYPIPEVIRGINAFTLGVRKVNPKAQVRVVWTNTWFGPPQEKEAAEALLAQGADIIAQHQDTTEPQKAAKEHGALSIGYDSDMRKFVGDTVLTSPVWNWGVKYAQIAQAVLDGTYKSESYWGPMADGIVDLAPLSPKVPDDVKALVEKEKQAIVAAGSEDGIFCGPLKGANGVEFLPEGQCMTDEQLLGMNWFVEGVSGKAPAEAAPIQGKPAPQAAAPTPAPAAEKPKVAFVYVGARNDLGWSYAHDQGRLYLEKELGVETAYSELVPEGPDATRVIRDYAQKGYKVIFATSFGYMDSVLEVAADYPDTVFEHATGYKMADNVGIYDGRGYQGWYLAGMVAGKMTKKNILGYVAPYPIPEVIRNMNAFTLGARSVNPNVEVHPVWIFSWYDPPKEREAAQALLDLGADVIARESDSTEPDKVAQENGVYAIGYNAYVPDVAPDALLTAPIWHWGVLYKKIVQDVMDGTWKPQDIWWGMKEGLLDLAPYGKMVPDDVRKLVDAKKAEIVSGDFDVFVGPIKDNKGQERVPAGHVMTDKEKRSFNWLVEGVVGEIPK
ncbi:MAG: BMP family ABC transporter substrate-binding protein [Anaerolineae bacterium]|nr:BMP family ABC transporter substrate-binding protein [Anaerolineae bacterium]